MSAHDSEDLVASLNAAEFYIRTQASLYLNFPAILRVDAEALGLTRGLLQAVGVDLPRRASAPVAAAPVPAAAPAPVPAVAPAPVPAVAPASVPSLAPAPAAAAWEVDDAEEIEELEELDVEFEVEPEPEPAPEPPWVQEAAPTPLEASLVPASGGLVEDDEEEVGDPATFGDPEETEDLLREQNPGQARTVGEAMAFGAPAAQEDLDTSGERATEIDEDEEEFELEVEDPGQDALVTIEDTSDPRSDLEGLSRMGDSDLDDDDDSVEDEVIVRKDDGVDSFDLMPESHGSDMSPDEEETFVADLADIERMKAKMDAAPVMEDTSDAPSNHEVVSRFKPPPPAVRAPTPAPAGARAGAPVARAASPTARAATPAPAGARAGAPAARVGGPSIAPAPRVAGAGTPAGAPPRAGVTAGLYGNPAVPTIRDRNEPKPRAAAIQIDAAQEQASKGASGAPLLEEEELLELGSSEDYGEAEQEGGNGLSLDVQEYEEDLEEVEIEEDDDLELEEVEEDVPLEPIDDGPSQAELDATLHKAAAAVERGDMEAGIDFYSDVLDSDPDNMDARVKRGRLYLDYGDYSRAMSDFMMAEELAPQNPEPQIAVGDLYFARKDYNRAIDYFNEALKIAPSHAMAFCRRGISHYYRKNYTQALEDLNRAEKIDAEIPNIRTYVAMAKKKVRK